jgi:hypothetical protein
LSDGIPSEKEIIKKYTLAEYINLLGFKKKQYEEKLKSTKRNG